MSPGDDIMVDGWVMLCDCEGTQVFKERSGAEILTLVTSPQVKSNI